MRTGRRQFLGGLLASGLIPAPSWADAGTPAYLTAAAKQDGSYVLCGISADLDIAFQLPLPARGHAAAGHPKRPEAVAFARRPGRFAVIIDCITGRQLAQLDAPDGRHFYGHGVFSRDGDLLFTTENHFEAGAGRIGVWDAARGYTRVDEWDSGGIGPHDIKRLPGTDVLVVANGGIDTHPDTGRTKLNIPTMRPNLAYVEQGKVVEAAELSEDLHKNSIRHLAVSEAGQVAFGMQWQGDGHPVPLVGTHRRGASMLLMQAEPEDVRRMEGYIGSIAFSADGRSIAATSPRGGYVQVYDALAQRLKSATAIEDTSGVAPDANRFVTTSGTGAILRLGAEIRPAAPQPDLMFDNHLVALG